MIRKATSAIEGRVAWTGAKGTVGGRVPLALTAAPTVHAPRCAAIPAGAR